MRSSRDVALAVWADFGGLHDWLCTMGAWLPAGLSVAQVVAQSADQEHDQRLISGAKQKSQQGWRHENKTCDF